MSSLTDLLNSIQASEHGPTLAGVSELQRQQYSEIPSSYLIACRGMNACFNMRVPPAPPQQQQRCPGACARQDRHPRICTQIKSRTRNTSTATKPKPGPRLSRIHAPADLSPIDWQRALRRQFGREQAFGLVNLGEESFFSDFRVSNPASGSSYRVAIRGHRPGDNFCSCPDYATNELGTGKLIDECRRSSVPL